MWDIETALKRFIKARRVVIVADACHAAGVGQAFDVAVRADRGLQVNQINSGLQNLTEIGEGVCVTRATRNAQNPIVAGRFDPSLVIGK